MILGLLVLITALSISAVAIYYSVAGLVAIFAAAALPIMIMGGVLEVGKLVTAVWLHKYWKQATWWLKSYLSIAVIVLMLITSMGIFGFLSKAHIEQTAASVDNLARVETMQSEIDRQLAIVSRAEDRIRQLESSEVGADANVQAQIDKEQERIDGAYERIQPAIQEQNQIIANVTALFQTELDRIDEELATLQGHIDAGDIRKAQAMVGARADGAFGPRTAAAFTAWQDAKRAERAEWLDKIQQAASSPTVVAAREEIARLRNKAEQQIADSNVLINRLRDQLGNSDNAEDVQQAIDEQIERVRLASQEIDSLTEEKIALESEYRKLEAEVGPIKYIAEFIYGETADTNLLEEAVRWVIIVIIFVFDPLAVLLLIASQYTFEFNRKRKDDSGDWLRQWREYEQARAQRIVDNPGFTPSNSVPETAPDLQETNDENTERKTSEKEQQDAEELRTGQNQESLQAENGHDSLVASSEKEQGPVEDVAAEKDGSAEILDGDRPTTGEDPGDTQSVPMEQEDDPQQNEKEVENATADTTTTDVDMGDILSKNDIAKSYITDDRMEQTEVQVNENRHEKLEVIPDTKNRMFYADELDPNTTYLTKDENGNQVRKYKQNEEQSSQSLWNRIQRGKE